MTCGPAREGDRLMLAGNGTLSGSLRAVAFAKDAEHLAVLARRDNGGVGGRARRGVAGAHRGRHQHRRRSSQCRDLRERAPLGGQGRAAGVDEQSLQLMGAAVRAMQMAGALEAILELAVAYANERVAFERPIAKFQAVQHNLARLAGEVAVAIAAAGSAADAIATHDPLPPCGGGTGRGGITTVSLTATPPHVASKTRLRHDGEGDMSSKGEGDLAVFLEVASAKIRVGEAATEGAAIAHQVLGAIGFTQEHILHRYTRRLWAWRDDFGNESAWAVKLGQLVAAKGADGLWPMLAER